MIVISVCASLTTNALGLLLAAIGKSEQAVNGLSLLRVVTLAALGGVMEPRFVIV